jgi:hypothetical protein
MISHLQKLIAKLDSSKNGCLGISLFGFVFSFYLIYSYWTYKPIDENNMVYLKFKISKIERIKSGRSTSWEIKNTQIQKTFIVNFAEKESKENLYVKGKKIRINDSVEVSVLKKNYLDVGKEKVDIFSLIVFEDDYYSKEGKTILHTLEETNSESQFYSFFGASCGFFGIISIIYLYRRFKNSFDKY